MAWFNPYRWLALLALLAALFSWHYFDKKSAIEKAVTDVYTAATQAALVQSEAARKKEKALNLTLNKVRSDYARQKAINDDLSRSLDVGLRDFQTTNSSTANNDTPRNDTPRAPGTYGTGGLESELLGHCAATLVELAKEADRLEGKVVGLQAYINSIKLD